MSQQGGFSYSGWGTLYNGSKRFHREKEEGVLTLLFESKYRRQALQSWEKSRQEMLQEYASEFETKRAKSRTPLKQAVAGRAAFLAYLAKKVSKSQ